MSAHAKTPITYKGKVFHVPKAYADQNGLQYGHEIDDPEIFWAIIRETFRLMIEASERAIENGEKIYQSRREPI